MGQRSDEIKKHIDAQRSELTENLEKLEERVRTTADWRTHFNKRPFTILGAALGGGLLLGVLVPMRRGQRPSASNSSNEYRTATSARQESKREERPNKPSATKRELKRTWSMLDDIRAALIGVGASKVRDYLNNLVPGFNEHYHSREQERRSEWGEGPAGASQTQYGQTATSSPQI